MGMGARVEHAAYVTEVEIKLQRLRLALEEARRAILDAQEMLDEAQRKRCTGAIQSPA
jgi:hypothetical protein